eukprot:10539529-Lingulodinium_polyedra.AAC.1
MARPVTWKGGYAGTRVGEASHPGPAGVPSRGSSAGAGALAARGPAGGGDRHGARTRSRSPNDHRSQGGSGNDAAVAGARGALRVAVSGPGAERPGGAYDSAGQRAAVGAAASRARCAECVRAGLDGLAEPGAQLCQAHLAAAADSHGRGGPAAQPPQQPPADRAN